MNKKEAVVISSGQNQLLGFLAKVPQCVSQVLQFLLKEMKDLGEKAVNVLMNGPKEMVGSFKWVYSQTGTIQMNDGSLRSLEVVKTDLSPSCQQNYRRKVSNPKVLNSFHVFPASSIGYLHLHTYVGDLLTTAHETMEDEACAKGYRKNTSYEVVVSNIR